MSSILDYNDRLSATAVADLMGCLKEFTMGADLTTKYDLDKYTLPESWNKDVYVSDEEKREIERLKTSCRQELDDVIRTEVGFVHLHELKSLINQLMVCLAKYMTYEPDPEKLKTIIDAYDGKIKAVHESYKKSEDKNEDKSDVVSDTAGDESGLIMSEDGTWF